MSTPQVRKERSIMRILIVEPGKHPRVAEIENTLEKLQETVGGYIQAVYPWEDNIALP